MRYNPQLTTIIQDTSNMGKKAAERLIDAIESPKTTLVEQVVIPGILNKGDTVGRI